MKEIIYTYLLTIKKARISILEFYNIKENLNWREIRAQVPKSAFINKNLSYNFHGAGCELLINNTICDFDYAPINEFPIKFEIWKIIEFIRTNVKFNNQDNSYDFVLSEINKLVKNDDLKKLKIGDYIQDIYQIKKEYYETPEKLFN